MISALDLHISYIKIIKAATYLNRPNVLFIATNDDASLPQSDELIMPGTSSIRSSQKLFLCDTGAGTILASVATAACRTPTILGKPHAPMFEAIRQTFSDVDPKRTVMIGDRYDGVNDHLIETAS